MATAMGADSAVWTGEPRMHVHQGLEHSRLQSTLGDGGGSAGVGGGAGVGSPVGAGGVAAKLHTYYSIIIRN